MSVVVDKITNNGKIFVLAFGQKTYELQKFCDLGSLALWCGPIPEPEELFQSVTFHRMKSIEFRR